MSPSPVPNPEKSPTKITRMTKEPDLMGFPAAIILVIAGAKVTRLSWENRQACVAINDAFLCIYKPEDNLFHPFLVSELDMQATDWLVVP